MTALRIALPLAAVLIAGPALAQPAGHDQHHPAAAAAAQAPAKADDPAAMHERCRAMMGAQMQGKPMHDHDRDKTGRATPGKQKPPTAAEMQAMHERCAQMMGEAKEPKAK